MTMKKQLRNISVAVLAMVLLGAGCASKPPVEKPIGENTVPAGVPEGVPEQAELVEDNLEAPLEAISALEELDFE